MLTYLPTEDGGSEVQTIYFLPKGNFLTKWTGINLMRTLYRAFLVSLLFFDDMKIMNTLEFQTNFTAEDKLIGKWIRHVQGLDFFEDEAA